LVAAADTDYVLFRDDDITPAPAVSATDADLLILPLRMTGGDSLIERLQRAEYAAIQEVTVRTARRGRAVLCSGANLLVRRERWLESWPDLQPDIPSGDDMFLLESFRRRGLTIAVADDPRYTAEVRPLTFWRALLRQRMRWAGKAPRYSDPYIRRYGATVLLANILQLLCPLIIVVKFPIEYRLIKKRDPSVSLFVALLLELIYPIYMLIALIGGLRHKKW
jgi:cellulose synthase/poly-beta-1,6-N-acetylglucosamine synthase-like glycosyltransferase